jgi:hypothetical protein
MSFLIFSLLNGVAIVIGSYFIFEFNTVYNELQKNTDDYFALSDFGYSQTTFINPIIMLDIIAIPEIWNQIGMKLIISTVVYILSMLGGFFLFLPVCIVMTSIYLHYLIYLLKQVEINPDVNIVEIVLLEHQGEVLYSYLLLADFALAASANTILTITILSLYAKYHLSE